MIRSDAGFDFTAASFLDDAVVAEIASARQPDELVPTLSILLRAIDQVARAQEALNPPDRSALTDVTQLISRDLSDVMSDTLIQISTCYPRLRLEPTEIVTVSVIVPVHNKFRYTYDCVNSIVDNLPAHGIEVIIVDDGSSDETLLGGLVFSGAVRMVRAPRNLGFIGACNIGAKEAKGQYLFFLNNDTKVTPGWLDHLADTFEHEPNIGIAGSKLLFGDGVLQEVGRNYLASWRRMELGARTRARRSTFLLHARRRLCFRRGVDDLNCIVPEPRRIRPTLHSGVLRGHRSLLSVRAAGKRVVSAACIDSISF